MIITCTESKIIHMTEKIEINQTVPRKSLAKIMGVHPKTVKRWEEQYGWTVYDMNGRNKRLIRSEVEESLKLTLPENI